MDDRAKGWDRVADVLAAVAMGGTVVCIALYALGAASLIISLLKC